MAIFKKSLQTRLTFIFILVALIPVLVVIGLGYLNAQQSLSQTALGEVSLSAQVSAREIESFLGQFRTDLLSFKATPPIQGIMRANANDGLDPQNNDSYEVWVNRLQQIFSSTALNKGFYQQIRYLDQTGQEIVRVDFSDEEVTVIAPDDLQNKSTRPYFVETMQLEDGQIYVSNLNLNHERGQIQTPYTPVIRFGTPVFDSTGNRRGIVITNVYADSFLDKLNVDEQTAAGRVKDIYLLDQDGYYLHHPHEDGTSEKEFGFDINTEYKAEQDFAWIMSQINSDPTFPVLDRSTGLNVDRVKINYDPQNPDRYWFLLTTLPQAQVLADINAFIPLLLGVTLLFVIIIVIVAIVLARNITQPIKRLVKSSQQLTVGDFEAEVLTPRDDEIGQLAHSFQEMALQLGDLIKTLEDRVKGRTQALETSADISRRLTQILDIDELLRYVVTRIQTEFGFYHTHIYLLSKGTDEVIMAEGSGDVGRQLKAQRHSLRIGGGIVGVVAAGGAAFLSDDVTKNPDFVRNPLLPATKSELTVPIRKGDNILGVLDIQSDTQHAFGHDDMILMQSIANQVAVTIDNARLFEQTQEALIDMELTHQRYLAQSWEAFREAQQVLYAEQQDRDIPLIPQALTHVKRQVIQQGKTITTASKLNDTDRNGNLSPSTLVAPLKLRGQVIGTLGAAQDGAPNHDWNEDEIALIEAVSEQITQALERARLFGETQQRAAREKVIADMTQQIWASGDIETVMRTAVEQLGFTMDASRVVIKLGTDAQLLQQLKKEDENEVV